MNLDFLKRITGGLFLLTTEFNGIKNGCIINNCMEVQQIHHVFLYRL